MVLRLLGAVPRRGGRGGGGGGGGASSASSGAEAHNYMFPVEFMRLIGGDIDNVVDMILNYPNPSPGEISHVITKIISESYILHPGPVQNPSAGSSLIPSTPMRRSERNATSDSNANSVNRTSLGKQTRKFFFKGKQYDLPLNGPVGPALMKAIQQNRRRTPVPTGPLRFGGYRRLRKTNSRLKKTTRKTRKRN